jgi:hypothetical protein
MSNLGRFSEAAGAGRGARSVSFCMLDFACLILKFFSLIYRDTLQKAMYRKIETNIPRNETAGHPSQFLHEFMYL